MIISKYLSGWDHLEPVVLASVAAGQTPLFLGRHGVGKSSLARFIAKAVGQGGLKLQKYSMDKENIISMVGFPNPEAMKRGKLEYVKHDRSILNADILFLDEVTRAPKENKNFLLEILEEKTCFGIPLPYKFAMATANDESYQGTFKLDGAQLDRFYVVIPAPILTNQACGCDEIKNIIKLNRQKDDTEKQDVILAEAIDKIRIQYKEFLQDEEIVDKVDNFVSRFLTMWFVSMKEKGKEIYVSYRDVGAQFPNVILSIAAYYKTIRDSDEYLQKGAWDAILYCISTKLSFPIDELKKIYEITVELLTSTSNFVAQLKVDLTTGEVESIVSRFIDNIDLIAEEMDYDEIITMFGNMIEKINRDKIALAIKLYNELKKHQGINSMAHCLSILKLKMFFFCLESSHASINYRNTRCAIERALS